MFFVTILLNEMITWMRSQAGTSSLRAILYMDEVFGYFPPTQNPPSKQPMLTLLKQARAFGLGCILATQNPVDLDYKGLSNAGTWFLGRLQTERDKARVLEGLEGASSQAGAKFNRGEMEKTLAGLGSRVFLMNNVNDDEPVVFETRWAMSYLRGPLTRNQIQTLAHSTPRDEPPSVVDGLGEITRPTPNTAEILEPSTDQRQLIPASVKQFFVEPNQRITDQDRLVYRPSLLGRGRLHFVRSACKVDQWIEKIVPGEYLLTTSCLMKFGTKHIQLIRNSILLPSPTEGRSLPSSPPTCKSQKTTHVGKKNSRSFCIVDQEYDDLEMRRPQPLFRPNESLVDFKVRLEQLRLRKTG